LSLISAVNEFWALFPKGDEHKDKQNKTCKLSVYYVFICDKNYPWIPQEGGAGKPPVSSAVPGQPIVTYHESTGACTVSLKCFGAISLLGPAEKLSSNSQDISPCHEELFGELHLPLGAGPH
jgi:hypothetical protein